MANFEAFRWNISSSTNFEIMRSEYTFSKNMFVIFFSDLKFIPNLGYRNKMWSTTQHLVWSVNYRSLLEWRACHWTLPVLILNLFKLLVLYWNHQGLCIIFDSQLTMYDFHDSTDIFVNHHFVPKKHHELGILVLKVAYNQNMTWLSWIQN